MLKVIAKKTISKTGIYKLIRVVNRSRPVILMYHGVTQNREMLDWTQVQLGRFERQMAYLKEKYHPVPLRQMTEMMEEDRVEPYSVAITFDDGYLSNYELAYPILQKYKIPATIFAASHFVNPEDGITDYLWPDYISVLLKSHSGHKIDLRQYKLGHHDLTDPDDIPSCRLQIASHLKSMPSAQKDAIVASLRDQYGGLIDNDKFSDYLPMSPDNLRQTAEEGLVTIGAHSRNHPILSQLDSGDLEDEIVGSKKDIENIIGSEVTEFAYPNGRLDDITPEVVALTSKHYACAVTSEIGFSRPGHNRYLLRRIGIGNNIDLEQFRSLLAGVYLQQPRGATKPIDEVYWMRPSSPEPLTKRIRVLQLVEDFGTIGGAERVVHNLIDSIDDDTFESAAIVVGSSDNHLDLSGKGDRLHLLPGSGRFNLKTLGRIIRIIKDYEYDIVQSHLIRMNTYNWVASKYCGNKSICTIHGLMDVETYKTRLLTRLAIRFSSQTVAVSDYLRNKMIGSFRVPGKKLMTVNNAFDSSRLEIIPTVEQIAQFRQTYNCPEESVVIAAVGHLRPVKGYPYLIDAIEMVKETCPKIKLLIAGYGTTADIKFLNDKIKSRQLENNITLLGEFSNIRQLFSVSDLYVSSSIHEGFSLTTIEAMVAGLPAVATRSGGPQEIIEDGKTGLLVATCNSSELAQGILKLVEDKSLANQLARAGQIEATAKYSMERFAEAYKKLYESLLDR